MTIREDVIEEEEEEVTQEEGETEEIIEYADKGDALVIWRSLNMIQENEES